MLQINFFIIKIMGLGLSRTIFITPTRIVHLTSYVGYSTLQSGYSTLHSGYSIKQKRSHNQCNTVIERNLAAPILIE